MLNKIIQKEHDLVCSGCGCVLGTVDEDLSQRPEEMNVKSIDVQLLGSALSKNWKYSIQSTRQQLYEDNVLRNLQSVCKKYALPERLANEAFNILKKKNRGFRSEKEPIKQLLKILGKDENYLYIHKYRAIKARYEKDFNL